MINYFLHEMYSQSLNSIRPGLLVVRQAWGVWLRGPDSKNQVYHKPIEMKLFLSQYRNKRMLDAKFEFGSFSSFGDMMSQNFALKREQVIKFGYLSPENGFNSKNNEFLCSDSFISTQN